MKKGLGTLLAITLAVTVFVNPGAAPQPIRQPTAVSPALTEKKSQSQQNLEYQPGSNIFCKVESNPLCMNCERICPAQDLIETIDAFFGSRDEKGNPIVPWPTGPGVASLGAGRADDLSAELRGHWEVPREAREHVRFAIAILPDPVHTHLNLAFDNQIDAIQQAIEVDGYLFARATMPWDHRGQEHPEPYDFRLRLMQMEYERDRERLPGLMIFRKADPADRKEAISPLFVFVVGETPTGGINKRQFQMVLKAIESILEGTKRSTKQDTLSVFGPTYSGSLYSLVLLLHQERALAYPNVVIHSGTVSSSNTIQWCTKFLAGQDLLDSKSKHHFIFRTFQDNDCDDLIRFIGFVKRQGYETSDVALLSEDETAYGNLAQSAPTGSQPTAQPSFQPASCAVSDLLHIHFPREIAHFRSAYQHDVQNEESNDAGGKHQRLTLRSNLEDTGSDDDSVPQYSRLQTPLAQEAILMGIILELRVHRTKFVVLQASNQLDTFFLGKYLRKSYPEGRIVTVGADLLFQREVDDPRLHGILAISPYPLFAGIDDEAASVTSLPQISQARHVFPSSFSVGSFNAMLALLRAGGPSPSDGESGNSASTAKANCENKREGETGEISGGSYAQHGWPAIAGAPPTGECALTPLLWLTILGRNGYVPLALLGNPTTPGMGPALSAKLPIARGNVNLGKNILGVPLPWIVLCCVCIAAAFTEIYLVFSGSILARSETLANFAPVEDRRRNFVLFVGALLMVITNLLLLWPLQYWWENSGGVCPPNGVLMLVCLMFVGLVACNYVDLRRRGSHNCRLLFAVVSPALALVVLWPLQEFDIFSRGLVSFRYMAITSGTSQLMPLLLVLAAGVWWAWYTLAGLALLDKRGPRLPTAQDLELTEDDPALDDPELMKIRLRPVTEGRIETLRAVMLPGNADKRIILPPIVGLALSFLILWSRHPIRSVESKYYDWFYWACLAISIFVLCYEVGRLATTWMELRSLLLALDRLPLRRGFERLKGFTWKPLWRMGVGSIWDFYRLVSRQLETVHFLANLAPREKGLRKAIIRTDGKLKEIADSIKTAMSSSTRRQLSPKDTAQVAGRLEALQREMASTCGATLKYLIRQWEIEKPIELFELPEADVRTRKSEFGDSAEVSRVTLGEDFVCQVYLSFILSVIQRMRTLIMTIGGMFVFTLLSFSSYPFAGKSYFHSLMVGLFVVIVGTVGFVFAQMHRDATLSGITDTTPGELGFDFWMRLASFVAVPLLSLLAAQFPEINSALFSWLQPAYETLK